MPCILEQCAHASGWSRVCLHTWKRLQSEACARSQMFQLRSAEMGGFYPEGINGVFGEYTREEIMTALGRARHAARRAARRRGVPRRRALRLRRTRHIRRCARADGCVR